MKTFVDDLTKVAFLGTIKQGVGEIMKNNNRTFWGIVLIVVGVAFLLDRLVPGIDIFFRGWWTLFLIVPAVYHISQNGFQTGNIILLGVGVYFLVEAQGWNYSYIILPAVLILFGIAFLVKRK